MYKLNNITYLKVPKRENFSLAFFALSEPIWVCDLGTGEKNQKLVVVAFEPISMPKMCFLENFEVLVLL